MVLDKDMVQRTYDFTLNEIRELENKRDQLASSGDPVSRKTAMMVEAQINKKKSELESIEYALYNMT